MRKSNGFEGGSAENGTGTGTLTAANSDGSSVVSGDALVGVTSANATLVFDNTVSFHGTYSIRSAVGGTSASSTFAFDVTAGPTHQTAFAFRTSDNTVLGAILQYMSGGGSSQVARVNISAAGRIEIRNAANTLVTTGTATLANNTWYRIRTTCTIGTTGTMTVYVYDSTETTLLDTITAASANFGTSNTDRIRFSQGPAATNIPSRWFDAIVATDEGLPGPWTPTVDLVPAVVDFVAVPLSPVPQPVSVTLTPAVVTLVGVPLNPAPQPVSVALTPAVVTFVAVPLTPTPGQVTVALQPAAISIVGVPLSPAPQPVTVTLQPAGITLSAVALSPQPGQVTVQLAPAVMSIVAVALSPEAIAPPAGDLNGTWGIEVGV